MKDERIVIESRDPGNGRPIDFTTGTAGYWLGCDFARDKDWTSVIPWPPEEPNKEDGAQT